MQYYNHSKPWVSHVSLQGHDVQQLDMAKAVWNGQVLAESDASVLVMQRSELTRLRDTDGDGLADNYETVFDGFGMSGNYHEFGFGTAQDADVNLYVSLGTASNGGSCAPNT